MTMRLFIGIELSPQVKRDLTSISNLLKDSLNEARWVPEENLHLTIKFIGAVDENRVEDIEKAIHESVIDFRKFAFSLCDLGAFPSEKRARVLWVGVQHGADELVSLSKAIDKGLSSLGFKPEDRKFTPHITIARLREPKSVSGHLAEVPSNICVGRFVNVDKVTLFQSHLKPTGAEYKALKHITLPA